MTERASFVINRIIESDYTDIYDSLISLDSVEDLLIVCEHFDIKLIQVLTNRLKVNSIMSKEKYEKV